MSEDSDLERFFTNAEPACQAFEHLISAPSLSKRLLVVHGIGGVGKSTLLRMYRLSCQRQGIPVALFTGEETPSLIGLLAGWMKDLSDDDAPSTFEATLTRYRAVQAEVEKRKQAVSTIPGMGPLGSVLGGAEDLVDWLRDFLSRSDLELYLDPIQRLTHSFLEDLAHIAADRRVVLMVDTYERMTTQDDWTRDLALRLPENVLLVISGRTMPRWERAWPGWLGRAEIVRLREMSPNDLRTLVRRYYAYIHSGESDSEQVEAIVRFARGLPMVATTVVRLWVQYGVEELEAVLPQVVTDLVERLLGGVSTEMRSTLEVAAVLRYFNADALRALLSQENDRDANTLYAELRRWPFVISQREGLAVHATMREMMNQELRVRTPERFRVLHERATEYYEAQLQKATGGERERLMLERLYHRVCADEPAGMQLFQEAAEERMRYRLLNQLQALLNDANTYSLKHENSRLWREYYNARLAHLLGRPADAEKAYQAIGENEDAAPKLRAYALCDWGRLLAHYDRLGQAGGVERATSTLEHSLSLARLDSHLVQGYFHLARVQRYQGKWDEQAHLFERAREFFQERQDEYGLAYVYSEMRRDLARRGLWRELFDVQERLEDLCLRLPSLPSSRAGF